MTPTQLSQSAPVLALAKIQLERQLPDGDFCRTVKFDMSGSSWGKIKKGTFSGNASRALNSVKKSLAGASAEGTIEAAEGTIIFDHILDAVSSVEIARRASDEHRLVIICGTYGSGKSTTARHLIRAFGGQLIHAKPSWTRSYLECLTEIAKGLGLTSVFRSAGSAERAILAELAHAPRLIVIDEANHFNASGLNFLKTILNETKAAIVLCTLPNHLNLIAAVHREESRQLVRRAVAIIHIGAVTSVEVSAIRDHLYSEIPKSISLAPVVSFSNRFHRMDTVNRILREIDPDEPECVQAAIARVEKMIRLTA